MSDRRTSGQLFFMAVLYTLFFRSSRGILTKNYRNYYKAVTVKRDSFHYSVILLTKPCFRSYKSCNLSHFCHFLKFLLQCDPLPEKICRPPFFMPFLHVFYRFSRCPGNWNLPAGRVPSRAQDMCGRFCPDPLGIVQWFDKLVFVEMFDAWNAGRRSTRQGLPCVRGAVSEAD